MLAISYRTFATPQDTRKTARRVKLGMARSSRQAIIDAARLQNIGRRVRVVRIKDGILPVTGEPAFTLVLLRSRRFRDLLRQVN